MAGKDKEAPGGAAAPATRLAALGRSRVQGDGAAIETIAPPVRRASTILFPDLRTFMERRKGMERKGVLRYGLAGTEAHRALEDAVSELEGADDTVLVPSGMAAIALCYLALARAGGEALVTDNVYEPHREFCDDVLSRLGVRTRYFDPRIDEEGLAAMLGDDTLLVFVESPGSLTFELSDIPALARAARRRGVPLVADNTWATPLHMRPLELGADVSLAAATKYYCGGSDVLMGTVSSRGPVAERLHDLQSGLGYGVASDDAWLVLRGIRSLPLRLERHGRTGLELARRLEARPEAAEVFHPGLPGHPDHAVFRRDFRGASGLFSFRLAPRGEAALEAFFAALRVFGLGYSWGGFASLALPCFPGERREAAAPEGTIVRLYAGLEDPEDLWRDLEGALEAAAAAAGGALAPHSSLSSGVT